MALRVYSSASYNSTTGKTLVGVKEADDRETVLFNATLDGDHTSDSDAELIKLALDWFTLRYVKDFSDQLLNDKVNEATKAAKASQEAADEAKKVIVSVQNDYTELIQHIASVEEERNERFEMLEATVNRAVVELTTMFAGRLAEEEQTADEQVDEKATEEVVEENAEDVEHETTIE